MLNFLRRKKKNSKKSCNCSSKGLKCLKSKELRIENLEERQLLSISWGGGGNNNLWSNGANWVGGVAPTAGTDVVFSGSTQTSTQNDLSCSLKSITFSSSNFTISGNAISLTGNITLNSGVVGESISAGVNLTGASSTVSVGSGSNLTLGGAVTDTNGLTLNVSSGSTMTLSGGVSGPGALALTLGSGSTMTLGGGISGASSVTMNDPSGSHLTVNGGIANIGSLTATEGSGSGLTINGGISGSGNVTITEGSGATLTVSGGIADTGVLAFTESSGANATFSDAISGLSGMTMNIGSGANITASGDMSIADTTGMTWNMGSGANATLSGNISGTTGLAETGSGTVTLAGHNSFSGTTTISAGTLKLNSSDALGGSTLAYSTTGGTLNLGTLTSVSLGGLSGDKNIALTNSSGQAIAMTVGGNNATTTYSGVLSGLGSFTKAGDGEMTLAGSTSNTYVGGTTVAGTLILAKTGGAVALPGDVFLSESGDGTSTFLILNGDNEIATTSCVMTFSTPVAWAHFDLNGNQQTLAGLQSDPWAVIEGRWDNTGLDTDSTLTINNNSDYEYIGTIRDSWTGTGTGKLKLVKTGSGTLTLSGASTGLSTGGITVNGGTLVFQDVAPVSNIVDNAAVEFNVVNTDVTYSGVISGSGTLNKIGGYTLTLSGDTSNTYSGATTISDGTVILAKTSGYSLPGNFTIANPNTFLVVQNPDQFPATAVVTFNGDDGGNNNPHFEVYGNTVTVGGIQGVGGAIENTEGETGVGDGTLIINSNTNASYNGIIRDNAGGSGTLTVVKEGCGTWTVGGVPGGSIAFSGDFDIQSGAVQPGTGDALSAMTVNCDGGTLSFGDFTAVTLGGLKGTQDVVLVNDLDQPVAMTVGVNSQNTEYSGDLSGTGSLTKVGTGTLILSGDNTQTGGTTITAGTLQLGSDDAIPANSAVEITAADRSPAVLDLNGHNLSLSSLHSAADSSDFCTYWDEVTNSNATTSAKLTVNNATEDTYDGFFSGNLALDKYGVGKLTVTGGSSNTGDVAVYDGTLHVVGYFSAAVYTVSGYGTPQICGEADPAYVTVTSLITPSWERLYTYNVTAPYVDLHTVLSSYNTDDWHVAVWYSISGSIGVNQTGLAVRFPTGNPNYTAAGFDVGTVADLKTKYGAKFDIPKYTDANGQEHELSAGTRIIVMEDETGLPANQNDTDYDDVYWIVNVSSVTTMPNPLPPPDDLYNSADDATGSPDKGIVTTTPTGDNTTGLLLPRYNSQEGSKVDIQVNHTFNSKDPVPDSVSATLTFYNGGVALSGDSTTYSTTGFLPGDTAQFVLQFNASGLSSGRYAYEVDVVEHRGQSTETRQYTGYYDYVTHINSEFGKYWWLDQLDQIVPCQGGVIFAGGNSAAGWISTNTTPAYFNGNTLTSGSSGYTINFRSGEVETFNSVGRITSHTDAQGNSTNYYYGSDRLSSIVDSMGRSTVFHYSNGLIDTITDCYGNVVTLGHTGTLLTSIRLPNPQSGQADPVWTYEYDGLGLVTKVIDPNGSSSAITYTYSHGMLTTQVYPSGGSCTLTTIDLLELGSLVNADDAVGRRTDLNGLETTYTLDRFGLLTSESYTLNGTVYTTSYQRDDGGRITQITKPDPDGDGPLGPNVTTYSYATAGSHPTYDLLHATYGGTTSETWTYTATGMVSSHTDTASRATTYSISNGVINSMTQGGVTTNYTYTDGTGVYASLPKGLILTETDPLGHRTEYTYGTSGGALGLVTSITYAAESTTYAVTVYYQYDGRGNIIAYTDERGNTTTYTYDSLNQCVSMTEPDPDGSGTLTTSTTTYQYDLLGNVTHSIDAQGNDTQTQYDSLGLHVTETILPSPGGTTIYTYNSKMQLASVVDAQSHVTQYVYDVFGRVTSVTDAVGGTTYGYDVAGDVTSVTDALGKKTTEQYDILGRLIKVIAPPPDGSSGDGPVTQYTYNGDGQVLTMTDPLLHVTTYTYNNLGLLATTVNAAGTTAYGYDDDGNQTSVTDAMQHVTTYGYDARNRLTTISNAAGTTTYTYDAAGNCISVQDARGYTTSYQYDARNRLTKVTDDAGHTDYTYDDAGNLKSVKDARGYTTSYLYNNMGWRTDVIDALNDTTHYTYDALGNVTSVTDPLQNMTSYQYNTRNEVTKTIAPAGETDYTYDADGRLTDVKDALNVVTHYVYDALGRQTSVTLNDVSGVHESTDAADVDVITSYTYDADGNRLTETDSDGNTTVWGYDNLNRVHTETVTDSTGTHISYYDYNAIGLLTQYTDAHGWVTTYTYDSLGRKTGETSTEGLSYSYTYDPDGNLLTAGDSVAQYTYSYDALDRLSVETQTFADAPTVVFTYQYNANGQRTEVAATVDGVADYVTDYVYNEVGLIKSIRQHGATGVADKRIDFTYDADGQYDVITYYNDCDGLSAQVVMTAKYGYNSSGWLTSLVYKDQSSTTIRSFGWNYNADGRVISHNTDLAHATEDVTAYHYDANGQLLSADYASSSDETYTYDENGNRVYPTEPNNGVGIGNQTTSDGTYQYVYDADGNLVEKYKDNGSVPGQLDATDSDVTFYTWDSRSRLTEVTHRAVFDDATDWKVDYEYDVFNQRIASLYDGNGDGVTDRVERYVWQDGNVALDFVDPDGDTDSLGDGASSAPLALAERYVWNPQAVDQLLAQEAVDDGSPADVSYIVRDNLGSTRSLVDSTGQIAATYSYDTYGNLTSGSPTATRYLYTCQEYDGKIGLYYYDARWYDPSLGKFISVDPSGFSAGDANLYRYVGNDPMSNSDPTGLAALQFTTTATTTTTSSSTSVAFQITSTSDTSSNTGTNTVWVDSGSNTGGAHVANAPVVKKDLKKHDSLSDIPPSNPLRPENPQSPSDKGGNPLRQKPKANILPWINMFLGDDDDYFDLLPLAGFTGEDLGAPSFTLENDIFLSFMGQMEPAFKQATLNVAVPTGLLASVGPILIAPEALPSVCIDYIGYLIEKYGTPIATLVVAAFGGTSPVPGNLSDATGSIINLATGISPESVIDTLLDLLPALPTKSPASPKPSTNR